VGHKLIEAAKNQPLRANLASRLEGHAMRARQSHAIAPQLRGEGIARAQFEALVVEAGACISHRSRVDDVE